ncbi:hypothetical protein CHLNCDRAFT_53481 [Chlorella variabilis]|uniref:Uncharacterized protein n=1 Tax=Chlorella variabilis TaxID=554065 RepID=E1ZJA3_CHLVA|nr:hypothetical protein CHLNCDRAFT_53481 [Chlorella variabilis]EFN53960.1 hypothetical protein CHLNCDRAFT_53481 [Chlorella variabilis]|eukprot:XP_005846062.1 hypothetical protein CHLNCDRAFT_53481 [Chlorella variabilis]
MAAPAPCVPLVCAALVCLMVVQLPLEPFRTLPLQQRKQMNARLRRLRQLSDEAQARIEAEQQIAQATALVLAAQQPSPPPPESPPPPPPPPAPWLPLAPAQRAQADKLLTIFENASLEPKYGYAEVLGDGRGITFGRAGFTTETGDGLAVVLKYKQLKPQDNTLARFLPALERQRLSSGGEAQVRANVSTATNATAGRNQTELISNPTVSLSAESTDLAGLEGFIQAVQQLGGDPAFRQAQDIGLEYFYFNASQRAAEGLGLRQARLAAGRLGHQRASLAAHARGLGTRAWLRPGERSSHSLLAPCAVLTAPPRMYALSQAQLYDAWVQHGEAAPDSQQLDMSANGIAAWVSQQLGGSPKQGVNETAWLEMFLRRRLFVLENRPEFSARDSRPRVEVFSWLLQAGNLRMDKPIQLSWAKCQLTAGVHHRGPCIPQPAQAYSLGGVVFGDFLVPLG